VELSHPCGRRDGGPLLPAFERLDAPFEIAPGVVIPPGEYRFDRAGVEAFTPSNRTWRVGGGLFGGEFYGGRMTQVESEGSWHGFGGHLRLDASSLLSFAHLPQGDFAQRLWRLRAVYAFGPDVALSSFAQYDSESNQLA